MTPAVKEMQAAVASMERTRDAARVTRLGEYDADGRARFRVEWTDSGLEQSQVWTGTVAELAELLARNGLRAVKS